MKKFFQKILDIREQLSSIGTQHCQQAQDVKDVRFMNLLAFTGSLLIALNATSACLQFGARAALGAFVEFIFSLCLLVVIALNHRGYFKTAKHLGVLSTIAVLALLSLCFGDATGGSFMLLATASMPMIIFRKPRIYSFYFLLHILAFFAVYLYLLKHSPLLDLSGFNMDASIYGSIVSMFLVVYFSNRYLTNANAYYEDKLIKSKAVIEEKQRAITDSINHALRLQKAILPQLDEYRVFFKDLFVLYLPKDIVAGDFYWMEKQGDHVFIAACDCTGHGVPGGFTSMVCHQALNRAIREFGLTDPAQILEQVDRLVTAHYAHSQEKISDGMDVSLCALHFGPQGFSLQWAGANNPIWIVRNGDCIEFKGTRRAIGEGLVHVPFVSHAITLSAGDRFYLFSDGYADQFGGPNDKRLSKKRFRSLLMDGSSTNADEQKKSLEEHLKSYRGEAEQTDDVLVMGFSL